MEAMCSFETSVTFNGLHVITSQKTELFTATAVRILNLTEVKYFEMSHNNLLISLSQFPLYVSLISSNAK
jgi:hypothetical protein